MSATDEEFTHWIQGRLSRGLIFIHGKGGVGKTVVSQAIAQSLAAHGHRTLWVAFEDPTTEPGIIQPISPCLSYLNCDFTASFEEYAAMKIGAPRLARLFLHNKVIRYLAKAAPGIRELVLLGKVWFESSLYAHVVVDLPATGHGLTMFQSTENFSRLFGGGPLTQDAESMLQSFRDPRSSAHVIISLPEEMPLRESLDLNDYLKKAFPKNQAFFLVNRAFPQIGPSVRPGDRPQETRPTEQEIASAPLARDMEDYILKRIQLEKHNLRIWNDEQILFGQLDYIPPPLESPKQAIVSQLVNQLHERKYL